MIKFDSGSRLKCLLIAQIDWANLGYELSQALKSVGVDAIAIAQKPHSEFNFDPQPYIYNHIDEVKTLAKDADIESTLYSYDPATYHKLSVDGVTVGILYSF